MIDIISPPFSSLPPSMLEILSAFLIILNRIRCIIFMGGLVYSMINYFIETFRELFLTIGERNGIFFFLSKSNLFEMKEFSVHMAFFFFFFL